MMNFIDISSWQYGLDLDALFRDNPSLDGVVVKSTGGVSYVQTTCDAWVQWLTAKGKPFGFYHYLNDDSQGASGAMEARYFVANTKNYFGKGVPFVDYEASALSFGTKYLKECLDTIYSLTGVKAGVYCSLSVVQSQDFSAIASAGYPLWVAQYADMEPVYGFVDKPWQQGSVSPFNSYVMHQYTSCGHLNGYSGNLDFDKYYGSYSSWVEMARVESKPTPAPKELKPADPVVVSEVLSGKYGTNADGRVEKLRADGYDPESVQSKVNEIYGIALSCKKYINGNEDYLNSIMKVVRLL